MSDLLIGAMLFFGGAFGGALCVVMIGVKELRKRRIEEAKEVMQGETLVEMQDEAKRTGRLVTRDSRGVTVKVSTYEIDNGKAGDSDG